MSGPKLAVLAHSNYRYAAPTLRNVADEIEGGRYGDVRCVALVLIGDTVEVFGAGQESDMPEVHYALCAGAAKLLRMVEQ